MRLCPLESDSWGRSRREGPDAGFRVPVAPRWTTLASLVPGAGAFRVRNIPGRIVTRNARSGLAGLIPLTICPPGLGWTSVRGREIIAGSMRPRSLLPVSLALVALVACRDPDAPRPVSELESPPAEGAPVRPLTTRDDPATDARPVATSRPVPPGAPDPAESAISDLARLARYVFREMRLADQACPFTNPLHDPLSFIFHIEVQGGRMTQVHLSKAGRLVGPGVEPMSEVPPELAAYAACLKPRLQALTMDPAPPDGPYQPEYSYPGHQSGR